MLDVLKFVCSLFLILHYKFKVAQKLLLGVGVLYSAIA